MALGRAQVQQGFDDLRVLLGDRLREGSVYRLLADHGQVMFPDDYFADLYAESARGRPTVPARVVATVMLLQAFEGLSDREACDRLEFDLRWQAAAGADAGCRAFHPTVLAGMRNKLRASARPRRLFEDTKVAARAAGAMKQRARVLDSTPVFDAVATQDTVTQLRAAVRKVLATQGATGSPLAGRLRVHPNDPARLRAANTPRDQPRELLSFSTLWCPTRQTARHRNSRTTRVLRRSLESAKPPGRTACQNPGPAGLPVLASATGDRGSAGPCCFARHQLRAGEATAGAAGAVPGNPVLS